jgi:hypothetical protein
VEADYEENFSKQYRKKDSDDENKISVVMAYYLQEKKQPITDHLKPLHPNLFPQG